MSRIIRTRVSRSTWRPRSAAKHTSLLRFNCFDLERSYVYGPENPELSTARPRRWRHGHALPHGSDHRRQSHRLDHPHPGDASCHRCWSSPDTRLSPRRPTCARCGACLPDVEACARDTFIAKRNTVKHNRGTEMFEAGNIRFGLEMRRLMNGDGGLALHVLADVGGSKGKAYVEETELLAFDCFWKNAHYHYGPRNKNHRTNWDLTVVDDPLAVDLRAVREPQARRNDRACRLSGHRRRSRPGARSPRSFRP